MVWRDDQLEAAATLLRRFHDATLGSDLVGAAEVVCHNDFGPWNLVWRSGLPVAIIDFDNASAGARLDDLSYAIWKHLNLGLVELPPSEQARRLRLMTTAYGAPADGHLLTAIELAQKRMRTLIEGSPADSGRDEALNQSRRERGWLRTNRLTLFAAISDRDETEASE